MPKGKIYKKFTNLINKLAKEYSAPEFKPHVTLLGDIDLSEREMIKRTKMLVSGKRIFSITLGQIDYEDYFFRTLFVKATLTEDLQNLHNRAKEVFEIKGISIYMPHLSILYGNYPENVKKKIIQEIGGNQEAQWGVDGVVLMKGGEIRDWRLIKEFRFS